LSLKGSHLPLSLLATADPDPGERYMQKLAAKVREALQPDFHALEEKIGKEAAENKKRLDKIDASVSEIGTTLAAVLKRLDK
jgi:ABC-type Zn uptake system ZnuABC Zn-binding protein ZnuA